MRREDSLLPDELLHVRIDGNHINTRCAIEFYLRDKNSRFFHHIRVATEGMKISFH